MSRGTRAFPLGSESRAGASRGGRDPVPVAPGREGGRKGGRGEPGGRLAAYRLLLLDPRHAAAVTKPGSGAQRRGWRRWLPGSREGGIKRLLRHVALPLTGPLLLLLLLPPHSSPPRRLRQQRPARGTRQPPGRGSPPALRQLRSRTSLTHTFCPRSPEHPSPLTTFHTRQESLRP